VLLQEAEVSRQVVMVAVAQPGAEASRQVVVVVAGGVAAVLACCCFSCCRCLSLRAVSTLLRYDCS
jgi:hypothetical protein